MSLLWSRTCIARLRRQVEHVQESRLVNPTSEGRRALGARTRGVKLRPWWRLAVQTRAKPPPYVHFHCFAYLCRCLAATDRSQRSSASYCSITECSVDTLACRAHQTALFSQSSSILSPTVPMYLILHVTLHVYSFCQQVPVHLLPPLRREWQDGSLRFSCVCFVY